MPKKHRLTGEEIRHLSGRRMHGRYFGLLVAPHSGNEVKCAVVVSKKVAAKAVERNKIKRRARTVLATTVLTVKKPVALVLYAKRDARDAGFADIRRDIGMLFSKL